MPFLDDLAGQETGEAVGGLAAVTRPNAEVARAMAHPTDLHRRGGAVEADHGADRRDAPVDGVHRGADRLGGSIPGNRHRLRAGDDQGGAASETGVGESHRGAVRPEADGADALLSATVMVGSLREVEPDEARKSSDPTYSAERP